MKLRLIVAELAAYISHDADFHSHQGPFIWAILYIFNGSCTNVIVSRSEILTNLAVSLQCLAPSVSVSESPRCRIDLGARAIIARKKRRCGIFARRRSATIAAELSHTFDLMDRAGGCHGWTVKLFPGFLLRSSLHPPVCSSALPLFSRNTCPLSCAAYNARDFAVPRVGKEATTRGF